MIKINKIINNLKLYLFIGERFIKSKKDNSKINIIFLSIYIGISLGLMVLLVVLGIMNGFQENHISRRIEIGSFHINLSKKNFKSFTVKEAIEFKNTLYKKFDQFEAVVPYSDKEIIVKVDKSTYIEDQIIKLRAMDPDEIIKDKNFLRYFKITYGSLNLNEYSIILGEALGYKMLSRLDSEILLTPDISLSSLKRNGVPFNVSGFSYTGSYDYDRYWGFISIYSLAALSGKVEIDNIGIKLKDKSKQKEVLKSIKEYLKDNYEIQTDEEINHGFFAALKLEKAMIIFLFAMIFIMVGINTFGSLKLTISEKRKNIAILKALGAKPKDIEIIFLIGSLLVSFFGSLTGVLLGCFVVYNVMNIFYVIEVIINGFLKYISYLLEFIIPGLYFNPVKIYDTSVYYQTTFLVKMNIEEIILMCIFIITVTVLSAYIPVLKTTSIKPNEILRS